MPPGGSIPSPFLLVLVFLIMAIFAAFGLFARVNRNPVRQLQGTARCLPFPSTYLERFMRYGPSRIVSLFPFQLSFINPSTIS
jgi:hypothetical protein